jgi:hypothetical protein
VLTRFRKWIRKRALQSRLALYTSISIGVIGRKV